MRDIRRALKLLCCIGLFAAGGEARAQNVGFQINRYEPTAAGSWSFAVEHPWYSKVRDFSAGLTLNYAHNPLVFGDRSANGAFSRTDVVIKHNLLMHFDVAVALFDRLNVSLSLPVTIVERGQPVQGVTPLDLGAMGDPRLGLYARLYGQPDDAFSLSLGAYLWIPIGAEGSRAGDTGARVLPQLLGSGLVRNHWRWSLTAGVYYRPESQVVSPLADLRGGTIGSSLQFGGLFAYTDTVRRFSVGPELMLHTTLTGENKFTKDTTNLELLLGGHYNIASQVQAGLALGLGTLRDPGTPDFRLLFRLAYAPIKKAEPQPTQCSDCPLPKPVEKIVEKIVEKPVCDLSTCACQDIAKQCAPPPPPPEKLCMKPLNVNFMTNRDDLEPGEDPGLSRANAAELSELARQLNTITQIRRIEVQGHTDNRGSHDKNQDLSERRARSVMNWLEQHGVNGERLSSKGFSFDVPIADNRTQGGRAQNRRVQIRVLEPSDFCMKPAPLQSAP